jgi:hypothetical protein
MPLCLNSDARESPKSKNTTTNQLLIILWRKVLIRMARMGEGRGGVCTGLWWGNLRERDHWEDPDIDGRIILRWIFRKWEIGRASCRERV